MSNGTPTPDKPAGAPPHRKHDHPFLEAFNAEDIIDDPGHVREEPDTTSDADAPAP